MNRYKYINGNKIVLPDIIYPNHFTYKLQSGESIKGSDGVHPEMRVYEVPIKDLDESLKSATSRLVSQAKKNQRRYDNTLVVRQDIMILDRGEGPFAWWEVGWCHLSWNPNEPI